MKTTRRWCRLIYDGDYGKFYEESPNGLGVFATAELRDGDVVVAATGAHRAQTLDAIAKSGFRIIQERDGEVEIGR